MWYWCSEKGISLRWVFVLVRWVWVIAWCSHGRNVYVGKFVEWSIDIWFKQFSWRILKWVFIPYAMVLASNVIKYSRNSFACYAGDSTNKSDVRPFIQDDYESWEERDLRVCEVHTSCLLPHPARFSAGDSRDIKGNQHSSILSFPLGHYFIFIFMRAYCFWFSCWRVCLSCKAGKAVVQLRMPWRPQRMPSDFSLCLSRERISRIISLVKWNCFQTVLISRTQSTHLYTKKHTKSTEC